MNNLRHMLVQFQQRHIMILGYIPMVGMTNDIRYSVLLGERIIRVVVQIDISKAHHIGRFVAGNDE